MIEIGKDIGQESPKNVQMLPSSETPPTPIPSSNKQTATECQLSPDQESTLGATVSTVDLNQIWEWNKTVPAPVDRCVHDMIRERTEAQPTAPAICAWDGELTYDQLDRITTGLAGRYVHFRASDCTSVQSFESQLMMLEERKVYRAITFLCPQVMFYDFIRTS